MRRLALIAGALLAAAGCSSTASGAPANGGSYSSPDAVLAALQRAGAPCSSPAQVANPTLAGALSMTDCDAQGGQSDTVVVVFDTQAHALAYASAVTSADSGVMFSPGQVVVYGENWAVNTTPAYASRVKNFLGGQQVAAPSSGPS